MATIRTRKLTIFGHQILGDKTTKTFMQRAYDGRRYQARPMPIVGRRCERVDGITSCIPRNRRQAGVAEDCQDARAPAVQWATF